MIIEEIADLDISAGTASAIGTRKNVAAGNGSLTERNLGIADVVKEIAAEIGGRPAQVALAWTLTHPAVTSPIMGVKTMAQLEDNLGALDVVLSDEHRARLAEASAIVLGFPDDFLAIPLTRGVMFGEVTIEPRR
ncbi:aldo/keto reductase [Rhizobium sp. WYJ-E13]|uniref:aldo/keto reductase n=1 Tax=Rhizobium sp. WYJ-E13 TaxID=2849093 RepID=UPI0020A7B754|nr:aldo/keto reductase [Rhizobium sp. WYJ-E13]